MAKHIINKLTNLQDAGRPVFWPLMDEEFDLGAFRVRFIERSVHSGHSTFDFVLSSSQVTIRTPKPHKYNGK